MTTSATWEAYPTCKSYLYVPESVTYVISSKPPSNPEINLRFIDEETEAHPISPRHRARITTQAAAGLEDLLLLPSASSFKGLTALLEQ